MCSLSLFSLVWCEAYEELKRKTYKKKTLLFFLTSLRKHHKTKGPLKFSKKKRKRPPKGKSLGGGVVFVCLFVVFFPPEKKNTQNTRISFLLLRPNHHQPPRWCENDAEREDFESTTEATKRPPTASFFLVFSLRVFHIQIELRERERYRNEYKEKKHLKI